MLELEWVTIYINVNFKAKDYSFTEQKFTCNCPWNFLYTQWLQNVGVYMCVKYKPMRKTKDTAIWPENSLFSNTYSGLVSSLWSHASTPTQLALQDKKRDPVEDEMIVNKECLIPGSHQVYLHLKARKRKGG